MKGSEEEEQQLQQTWKEQVVKISLHNELCQNFDRYGSQFEANKGGDQSPSMEDEPVHTERRNLNVSQVKKLPEPRSAYFATNVSPDFRAPS